MTAPEAPTKPRPLASCPDCGNLFSLEGVIDCPHPDHKRTAEPTKPRVWLRSGNGYAILMACMDVAEKSGWSLKEWRAFSRKFRSGTWEDGFSLVCERFDVQLASSFTPDPRQWVAEQSETPPLELS